MATSQQQVQTHRHICSIVTQTRPTATIPQQRRKRKWQCIFFSSVSSRWNQNPQRHLEIRPEQHGDLMIHVTLQTTPVFTLIMTLWPLTWTPLLSDHVPSVLLWFWFSIVQQVSSASWAWSGFCSLTSSGSHIRVWRGGAVLSRPLLWLGHRSQDRPRFFFCVFSVLIRLNCSFEEKQITLNIKLLLHFTQTNKWYKYWNHILWLISLWRIKYWDI